MLELWYAAIDYFFKLYKTLLYHIKLNRTSIFKPICMRKMKNITKFFVNHLINLDFPFWYYPPLQTKDKARITYNGSCPYKLSQFMLYIICDVNH